MSENATVARAAGVVGGATLLSRVMGYVRDAATAWFFGASMSADAFFVAFRIPNLLRRLLAEGALTIAFIPVFSEYLERKGKEEAFEMAGVIFRLLVLVLCAVSALGIVFAPEIVKVMAPGFARDPEKLRLTILLTRITFPYIFFAALVALAMGVLNSLGHFAAPALSPVFLNLAMIASIVWIAPETRPPVVGLGIGVLLGGAAQLVLQIPFLVKRGFRFFDRFTLYHKAVKRILLLMGPAVLGAAVYQINVTVGTILASLLPAGSVSFLYYADRVVELPLGVFGIAMATAALPTMSRQAARRDHAGFMESFSYTIRLTLFITLPATVGLIVLREPIVKLLFERGAFDPESARQTAVALFYYALGLCFFSAVRIVVPTFYALQDTWTPVRIAIWSMLANAVFSLALMGSMLHGGLALSTSLSAVVNLLLLTSNLKKRLGLLGGRAISKSFARSLFCSLVMGVVVWAAGKLLFPAAQLSTLALGWRTAACILAGVAAYVTVSRMVAAQEFSWALSMVRRRGGSHGRKK
ncbi:MAG: murein biosynthesis integral membrane protein MurJ [Thermodesulfobacteriota bacterium]